eukprot:5758268-Alexandrium_andersonii.AAC.1
MPSLNAHARPQGLRENRRWTAGRGLVRLATGIADGCRTGFPLLRRSSFDQPTTRMRALLSPWTCGAG